MRGSPSVSLVESISSADSSDEKRCAGRLPLAFLETLCLTFFDDADVDADAVELARERFLLPAGSRYAPYRGT